MIDMSIWRLVEAVATLVVILWATGLLDRSDRGR